MLGALPTKGLPLPFVSFGGSTLVVDLFAMGILLNISRAAPGLGSPSAATPVKGLERGRAEPKLRLSGGTSPATFRTPMGTSSRTTALPGRRPQACRWSRSARLEGRERLPRRARSWPWESSSDGLPFRGAESQ